MDRAESVEAERAGDRAWLGAPRQRRGIETELAERPGYRLKCLLLGRPLRTEDLRTERLSKPVALAVLSSDVMSSCAYASESILRILIPAAGIGAFVLLTPVTGLLLLVLGLVCLCYRQLVRTYPVSGGSYVVSRENFGFTVAQIPGAALMLSYVLTVAVSIAAGVDAVISAFPKIPLNALELSLICVAILTYGNLRGITEAGKVFAVPTYWFFASMGVLVVTGIARLVVDGHFDQLPVHLAGHVPVGSEGRGLLLGAGAFLFLRGFANGGSAMTGMEAISNAVPVFRDPRVRNARTTLVLMASILGALFLSVSVFAALSHAVPFVGGTPTVLSEIGRVVFGHGTVANVAYYSLQFSTALILILGANTSYNGFPLLMNFIADDSYLPRTLRTRGHRLVYSNGIYALTALSVVLLVATRARVADLIPLYACTVFTGFTMAGAGMSKYHHSHRGLPHHRRNLVVAVATFVACAIVTAIFVVTEFTRGAWLVVVCIPLLIVLLTRTNRRYSEERQVLAEDSPFASSDSPILRRHIVLVLVDTLDLAAARAVQLARSLSLSSEIRAVHFVIDRDRAKRMAESWSGLGRWRIPLELVECSDRRLGRAARELAAGLAADGETEVTLVLPRRIYPGLANRIFHANTADQIVAAVSTLSHVSATIAPFDVADHLRQRKRGGGAAADGLDPGGSGAARAPTRRGRIRAMDGMTPIGDLEYRKRGRIAGKVHSVQIQPWSGVSALECTLVDGTGAVNVVFLGRRAVAGIEVGTQITVEGMVGKHDGELAIINPIYTLLEPAARESPEVS